MESGAQQVYCGWAIICAITKAGKAVYLKGSFEGYGNFYVSSPDNSTRMEFGERDSYGEDGEYPCHSVVCSFCALGGKVWGFKTPPTSVLGKDVKVADFWSRADDKDEPTCTDTLWPGCTGPRDAGQQYMNLKGHVIAVNLDALAEKYSIPAAGLRAWFLAQGAKVIPSLADEGKKNYQATLFIQVTEEDTDGDSHLWWNDKVLPLSPEDFEERFGKPSAPVTASSSAARRSAGAGAGGRGKARGAGKASGSRRGT